MKKQFTQLLNRFKKPTVNLHNVPATEINSDTSIIVRIDPQFAHMGEIITESIKELVGHDRVIPAYVPKGAIDFYTINHPYFIGVDMAAPGGDRSVEAPNV